MGFRSTVLDSGFGKLLPFLSLLHHLEQITSNRVISPQLQVLHAEASHLLFSKRFSSGPPLLDPSGWTAARPGWDTGRRAQEGRSYTRTPKRRESRVPGASLAWTCSGKMPVRVPVRMCVPVRVRNAGSRPPRTPLSAQGPQGAGPCSISTVSSGRLLHLGSPKGCK